MKYFDYSQRMTPAQEMGMAYARLSFEESRQRAAAAKAKYRAEGKRREHQSALPGVKSTSTEGVEMT